MTKGQIKPRNFLSKDQFFGAKTQLVEEKRKCLYIKIIDTNDQKVTMNNHVSVRIHVILCAKIM